MGEQLKILHINLKKQHTTRFMTMLTLLHRSESAANGETSFEDKREVNLNGNE
jgi:hypothetical protein